MKKLSLIVAFLVAAIATQASPLWMRYPAISPNGEQIAFCYKAQQLRTCGIKSPL